MGSLVAVRFSSIVTLAVLGVLMACNAGEAIDRAELGKVLQVMPPNGPFWKYGNVVMRRKSAKAGMDPVVFSHWSHRARYTCRVCHLELGFSMRLGDTGITREQYLAGKYCGACHDGKTSFSVRDSAQCGGCHMKDTRALEERFDKFAANLPMTSFGNGIDWAEALRSGQITPVNSIRSERFNMKFPDKLKAPIKLGTISQRSIVIFSHKDHFAELDCSSCHPDIFNIKKKGTEAFSMERNIYGNFCGACHMLVAFPMNDCKRCHPQMSNSSGY
ncbi:MAG TPA: c(7)-type cytochrome triheme domain-containing protein [Geobacteraceae bacterium]|nr:c(7)-type cytochrome triheme domain-containing protein [Geobacteraceae bacterium]